MPSSMVLAGSLLDILTSSTAIIAYIVAILVIIAVLIFVIMLRDPTEMKPEIVIANPDLHVSHCFALKVGYVNHVRIRCATTTTFIFSYKLFLNHRQIVYDKL